MDQDIARGKLDVAVVRVGDAHDPCLAQLGGRHERHGGGLLEQEAVFSGKLTENEQTDSLVC